MNLKKFTRNRRNRFISGLAVVCLVLVALCFLPALAAMGNVGGAVMVAALLPFGIARRCDAPDGAGYGGTMTEEQFQEKILAGTEELIKQRREDRKDITSLKSVANNQAMEIAQLKRGSLGTSRSRVPGQISEDFARYNAGIYMLAGLKSGKLKGDITEGLVKDILGIEVRTALTSSDIPMPVGYSGDVAELMSEYGAARKWATVFPLGAGSVNLPRLKTSPTFGLIAQSGTAEVSPQTEWVNFAAQKFGGWVRLPAEMEEDSIIPMGAFMARYSARELARAEDHNFFVGTGANSGVNGAVAGLCATTITNSKVIQMASTKTHFSDATLANIRSVRSVVDAPALGQGAYYMHPSFEQHLSGLNTAGDKPYEATAARGATLDGFPVRWVDIMPAWSASANASKVFVLFGDLRYQYLGVRGGVSFATSTEAAFTTDEIILRALERFTIGLMAVGAIAGLETAAS